MAEKYEYIGDGVYAKWNGYELTLMTGSHDNPDQVIYLEPLVWSALVNFMRVCHGTGRQPELPPAPEFEG